MKILFICKHNVFRSKVAEAYFKKINKNPFLKASSAGIIRGIGINKHQKQGVRAQRQVAKSLGLNVRGKPRGLSVRLLKKQDLIILTADDIPLTIFNNKEYVKKAIAWKIPDEQFNNKKNIRRTIKLIMKKIRHLVKQMENIR